MRLPILAALLALLAPTLASASDPPDARAAYVERRGLLEADMRCALFTPGVRAALESGATQARGALLRAGWSARQVRDLEAAVVSAAATRPCDDARTLAAADDARTAFMHWANASRMNFPGWERTWTARRVAGEDGWRLAQTIDAPIAGTFGIRDRGGQQRLVLIVPLARGEQAPRSARLLMRDVGRAALAESSLPQRVAYGLAAGAPSPSAAALTPSTRAIERIDGGRSQAVFTFTDTAFQTLLALDPRESAEVRIETGRGVQRMFVEVGDVAAARMFLTARAG